MNTGLIKQVIDGVAPPLTCFSSKSPPYRGLLPAPRSATLIRGCFGLSLAFTLSRLVGGHLRARRYNGRYSHEKETKISNQD